MQKDIINEIYQFMIISDIILEQVKNVFIGTVYNQESKNN